MVNKLRKKKKIDDKKNIKNDEQEEDLLLESEEIITELIIQLKDCIKEKHNNTQRSIPYNTQTYNRTSPKQTTYSGVGGLKSTCSACRERLFGAF